MSIFTAVRNQKQTAGALHGAMQYVMDPRKTVDGERNLVTGINCTAYTAFVEMMTTKRQFKKQTADSFISLCSPFQRALKSRRRKSMRLVWNLQSGSSRNMKSWWQPIAIRSISIITLL